MLEHNETLRKASHIVIETITTSNLLQKTTAYMVSEVGLSSGQQWRMLQLIERGGEVSPQSLIDRLVVSKQNVAAMIDRLEQDGFLAKKVHPTDRRSILLSITDKGRQALEVMEGIGARYRELAFRDFDADEIARLHALLLKLQGNLIGLTGPGTERS